MLEYTAAKFYGINNAA